MSIEVANESGVAVDESALASVARHVLAAMRVNPAAELSIMVVTTEVMTELHERWMDEPGPTDVMAFPMDELVDESRRPDAPEIGPALLGDVVLCPRSPRPRPARPATASATSWRCSPCTACCTSSATTTASRSRSARCSACRTRCSRSGSRPGTRPPHGSAQRRHDSRLLGTVGLEDS